MQLCFLGKLFFEMLAVPVTVLKSCQIFTRESPESEILAKFFAGGHIVLPPSACWAHSASLNSQFGRTSSILYFTMFCSEHWKACFRQTCVTQTMLPRRSAKCIVSCRCASFLPPPPQCHFCPLLFGVSKFCRTSNSRRRTNVQQLTCKMVWSFFFSFSFILFSALWAKTVVKRLDSKRKSWRKTSEKKLWKSAKMCGKVPKCVEKCRDDFAL